MTDYSHNDIVTGKWYFTLNSIVYVHERLVKGQTGAVTGAIPLPDGLDVVCGWNCGLLKRTPCDHKPPSIFVDFNSGSSAPMVSYMATTLQFFVDRAKGTLFAGGTQQLTSRSVGNLINLGVKLDTQEWGHPDAWEYENAQINSFTNVVINEMGKKEKLSRPLIETMDANRTRAISLYTTLLKKMARDDAVAASAVYNGDTWSMFENPGSFLAAIGGANSSHPYQSYAQYSAREIAFINGSILKLARAKYPKDVEQIMETYKKVQMAKQLEDKPFQWDTDHARKILTSKLRQKPVRKGRVDELPF